MSIFLFGCSNDLSVYNKQEDLMSDFSAPVAENVEIEDVDSSEELDDERETYNSNFYKTVACAVTPEVDLSSVIVALLNRLAYALV